MIVSFDFDGTLVDDFYGEHNSEKEKVQKIAKNLVNDGCEVWIVTKRFGPEYKNYGKKNEHLEVYELGESIGISKEKIYFTNRDWKMDSLNRIGVHIHFENSLNEVSQIRNNTKTKCVHVEDPNWEQYLSEILSN